MLAKIIESSVKALPDLSEAWDDCLSHCPPRQRLFTFGWYRAWLETAATPRPWTGHCLILKSEDDAGRTVALLPLACRRERGMNVLSLAGHYQPYRTFVCREECAQEVAEAFAVTLLARRDTWDVLRLDPYDLAAPEREAFAHALRRKMVVLEVPHGRTIVNNIRDSYDAYASEKTVKRIRSYERRFLRVEDHRTKHVSSPVGEVAAGLLDDLGRVEEASWLSKGGDLRFSGNQNRAFWLTALSQGLSPRGQFDAWLAYAGDRPLAFRVALTAGDVSYMIANQFDEEFSEHRLGWILYLQHLEQAAASGVRRIDSGPGGLHYKGRLGGVEAEMRYALYAFSPTRRGAAFGAAFRVLGTVTALAKRSRLTSSLAGRLPRL